MDDNDNALTAAQGLTNFLGLNPQTNTFPGQDAINAAQPATGVTSPTQDQPTAAPTTITSPTQVSDAGPSNEKPMIGPSGPAYYGGSVGQQTQQLNDQEDRKRQLDLQVLQTQGAAMQEQSGKKIDEAQQEADLIAKNNQQYVAARTANERIAANETANMMDKITTAFQRQPDPSAYWHEDGLRNALWLLSVAATSIANSNHPERVNQMLQLAMQERDKNVEAQKEGIKNMQEGVKMQATALERAQGLRLADIKDDHELSIVSTQALMKVMQAKAAAPGPATLKAAFVQLADGLQAESVKTAQESQKQSVDSYNKQLDRQNQVNIEGMKIRSAKALQSQQEAFKMGGTVDANGNRVGGMVDADGNLVPEKLFDRNTEMMGKELSASITADKAEKAGKITLPTSFGLSAGTDANGKLIPAIIKAPHVKDVQAITSGANETYTNYKMALEEMDRIQKESGGQQILDIAKAPPKLRSAITDLGFTLAKLKASGRVSNQEIEKATTIAGGADLDKLSERSELVLLGRLNDVKALMAEKMTSLGNTTTKSLAPFLDLNDNQGREGQFVPQDLRVQQAQAPSEAQLRNTIGSGIATPKEPETVKNYQEAKAIDETNPGQGLRDIRGPGADAVDAAAKYFNFTDDKGHTMYRSPDEINKTADRMLKDVVTRGTTATAGSANIPAEQRGVVAHRIDLERQQALQVADQKIKEIVNEPWDKHPEILKSTSLSDWQDFTRGEGLELDVKELENLANQAKEKARSDQEKIPDKELAKNRASQFPDVHWARD